MLSIQRQPLWDWGQEEKGMTEDEMAGWHHWLDGHESEWTQGVGDGQGGLACCESWGRKESNTTEWLNWTELKSFSMNIYILFYRNSKDWREIKRNHTPKMWIRLQTLGERKIIIKIVELESPREKMEKKIRASLKDEQRRQGEVRGFALIQPW